MSSVVMFYYVWSLGVIILAGSALSLSCFLVTRQKYYIFLCLMLFVYYFDVALVARTDFTIQNSWSHLYYYITDPIESTLLGGLLVGSMWACFLSYIEKNWKQALIPSAVFVALCIGALAIPAANIREFVFFSARGVVVGSLLVYMLVHTLTTSDATERLRCKKHLLFWTLLVCLCVMGFAWNIFFMFYLPSSGFNMSLLGFLPEHSMVENLFYIIWVVFGVINSVRVLSLHLSSAALEAGGPKKQFVLLANEHFAHSYNLSPREEEVMLHIVNGEGRRDIANKLFVSPSTIKDHTHNILKKTHTSSTGDLLQLFWRSV